MKKKVLKRKNLSRLLILAALLLLIMGWVEFGGSEHESSLVVFRVARDPIWNPIDFMGKEREMTAFSDELIRSIAEEEGMRVSFATTGANALFGGLLSDQFDVILTGAPPSPFAESQFVYSVPYFRYGPVVVVSSKSSFTNHKQLEGKILGAERGAATVFNLAVDPKTTIVPFDNIIDALEELSFGDIDGVILNVLPASLYTQSLFRGNIRVISSPLTQEGLRLVAQRNKIGAKFVGKFDHGLKKMKKDGRYDALLKRWGLPDPELP